MPVGAPRPRLEVGAQGVLPAVAKQSADMARLKRSLWQSKPDRKPVWKLPVCSLVVWEPSLGPGTQGPFLQQNDLPARDDSHPADDWGCYRPWWQERQAQTVGFQASCAASVWLLRCQTSGPAPRASIPESGPGVCLHSASLANTFLGQCSPAHG